MFVPSAKQGSAGSKLCLVRFSHNPRRDRIVPRSCCWVCKSELGAGTRLPALGYGTTYPPRVDISPRKCLMLCLGGLKTDKRHP